MATNSVLPPFPTFKDLDGQPLENGRIYIGSPGFEARTTPKASFFDIGLTIPTGTATGAAVVTQGGYPVRNGAPAVIYVDGDFAITVTDRNGVVVYSALNNTLAINVGGTAGPVQAADGSLAVTGFGFLNEVNTGWVRSAPGTVQSVVSGVVVSQQTTGGTVFQQPVSGTGFSSGVLAIAQPLDADLTAIAALSGTGLVARTGAGTSATRQITSADGSVAITNPAGVAGDIDLSIGGIFFRLNADSAGADVATTQNLLPQNVTLSASTQYEYELTYALLKTAGINSHVVQTFWGGTATFNNFRRHLLGTSTGAFPFTNVIGALGSSASPTTGVNISGTINFADARMHVMERGTFSVNAGGTVIPQYILSAAPGGAYSTAAGAILRIRALGAAGANVSQGSWA